MQEQPLSTNPLKFGLRMTKPHRAFAFGALAAVACASLFDGLTNFLLKQLIDSIVAAGNGTAEYGTVWMWALIYTITFTVAGLTWRAGGFTGMQWFTRMKATSYDTLFSWLMRHSAGYFSNRFAGALVSRISSISDGVASNLQTCLWQFLPLTIITVTGVITAGMASPFFSYILVGWVALFLTINVLLVRRKKRFSMRFAEKTASLRGAMTDSAGNIAAVHQSGHNEYEISHVRGYIKDYRDAHVKNWFTHEIALVTGNLLQMLFVGGMLSTAVILLQRGEISVGDVALVVSLVLQVIRHIFFLGNEMNRFMDDYGNATEGLKELLQPHEIVDAKAAAPLTVKKGKIEFIDVQFSYGKEDVFDRFNLTIPAGQKVGLVGHSGAGKTSLTAILLRQYEIQGGDIQIDGQSIKDVKQHTIRQSIAMVPQDTSLFHRSIRENIRYGRLDATDEEVEHAAKLAQAHGFISKLQHGYETMVGERGVKLSGGQRQRVAIARAILKNAPILVLDEATSALDSESEICIQKAFAELMKGKTVIAIAHRLSTLRMMDRIIVMEGGVIAEEGTHSELLEKKGVYARLWESQVSGFIQE